ncbi:hypothetical protein LTV02_17950 [Nocardia yamanashiensis]|uniref:hypothetical protein n=1 Tax=Nocardia yamanashiensis TaxID=209247 RepID=UPI001E47EF71|nr:hypothetical protein [Nocardia yamanashiensis]UGT45155.1 hypothetical protein LTV02_17950 [Nocardia yamanashiensis]
MACVISRFDHPNGDGDKVNVHWHELITHMVVQLSITDPSIALTWQPDAETGIQAFLSLGEASALADALNDALDRFAEFDDGEDPRPDWLPDPLTDRLPEFGRPWPQAGEC